jgi:uncharacterized membrane protein
MLFSPNYKNVDAAVIALLNKLGIKVNPQNVIDELEKHPDYPSLLAISDVLTWFGIDNSAYRVIADELVSVPIPFIAHTNINDDFVVVNSIVNDKIILTDGKKSNYSLPFADFKKRFKGTVLTVGATSTGTEFASRSIIDSLAPYKIALATALLLGCFILTLSYHTAYFFSLSWQILLLTLFKTTGLITSVLLLIQSIDKNNPLVQALCGGAGKTNCNAILTSKAAIVFKGLTWSEVGFFYFAGTWLVLLFAGSSIAVLQCLAILNIVSLPYTIYSINYQARVAKQWCVFCTVVQGLLWLEFTPLLTTLKHPLLNLTPIQFATLVTLLTVPIATWLIVKPLLKYNTELFNSTLKQQPKYALPHEDWSIVLGNVEANTILTMVSNPYCPPCSKTHQLLDDWLNKLDDIQLRIVFTANNSDEDIKTPVTRHLMALNGLANKTLIKNALHDWYEQKQKNYEDWAKTYPVQLNETKFMLLEQQRQWCDMAEIKTTPTMLVNGYRLPDSYQLHDIKYMLAQQ